MQISIIVPVYNVENYLEACLESILAQTMTDFELLLIDDGSRDRSGAICDRYAAADPRIRVFHIANGGVSAARNLGLDHAQGEFVVFVDSDDRIIPDHLQQFLDSGIGLNGIAFTNLLEERPACKRHPEGYDRIYNMPDCRIDGGHEACMPIIAQLLRFHCFGWTWNKLFSRATIEFHHLRFDEQVRYAEDELFTIHYCAHITHIVCNSHPTYRYRYVPTSLLRGKKDPVMLMQVRQQIYQLYQSLGYSDEILYLTARTQFSRLRHEIRHASWCDTTTTRQLAAGILANWQHYKRSASHTYFDRFYDYKAYCIGWLCCTPNSPTWARFLIKALHL